MKKNIFLLLLLMMLPLTACMTSTKIPDSFYSHAQHGTVNSKSIVYKNDSDDCEVEVYANKPIYKAPAVNGLLVKKEARDVVVRDSRHLVDIMMDGERTEAMKTFKAIGKASNECMEKKGWKHVKNSA